MRRLFALLVLLAVGVGVVVWVMLDLDTEPAAVRDEMRGAPETASPDLIGRGIDDEAPSTAPEEIQDPVDFVLQFGTRDADAARASLAAAMAARPGFLDALVAWIGRPDARADMPAGVSTTARRMSHVYRVLALIGAPAAKPLAALLEHPSEDVRLRGAQALSALGEDAGPVFDTLLTHASTAGEDKYVRAACVDALAAAGPAARAALPMLHAVLRDPDAEEHLGLASARALTIIGGSSADVLETCRIALRSDWYKVSELLLAGVRELGPNAKPLLPDLLQVFDRPRASDALWSDLPPVLAAIGVADDAVLGFLQAMVREAREGGFHDGGAAKALAQLGRRGQDELIALSAEGSVNERLLAIHALQEEGLEGSQLVTVVAEFVNGAPAAYQKDALRTLSRAEVRAAVGAPVVRPFLASEDPGLVAQALRTLASMVSPDRQILTEITARTSAASDEVAHAAVAALSALARAWPEEVLKAWIAATRTERLGVATTATESLAMLMPTRRAHVITAWLALLEREVLGPLAVRLLGEHAPRNPNVLAALRRLASSGSAEVRAAAVRVLGMTGIPADLDVLVSASSAEDGAVRSQAIVALRSYVRMDRERVKPVWLRALEDPLFNPRLQAALSLGVFGAEAAGALPKLEAIRAKLRSARYTTWNLDKVIAKIHAAVERGK